MKKSISFLLCVCMLLATFNITVFATDETSYYARIMFDDVFLYKEPTENNNNENIYFVLPQTYFVELLDKCENFYKARYLDKIGYVKNDFMLDVEKIIEKYNAQANKFAIIKQYDILSENEIGLK